jgi:hypothetical protein
MVFLEKIDNYTPLTREGTKKHKKTPILQRMGEVTSNYLEWKQGAKN